VTGAAVDAVGRWRYPHRCVVLDLDQIRERLSGRDPRLHPEPAPRRAAVAAILRPGPDGVEVLLIRRAERRGDPWSGHMAFPGGHQDPGDRDLLHTARRETLEEVGLPLEHEDLIARLDDHPAIARGSFTGMVVSPFLFAVEGDPPLTPNHEVAGHVWAPLGRMARGELDVFKEVDRDGGSVRLPGYEVRPGYVVWGMTHRMLQAFLQALS